MDSIRQYPVYVVSSTQRIKKTNIFWYYFTYHLHHPLLTGLIWIRSSTFLSPPPPTTIKRKIETAADDFKSVLEVKIETYFSALLCISPWPSLFLSLWISHKSTIFLTCKHCPPLSFPHSPWYTYSLSLTFTRGEKQRERDCITNAEVA